MRSTGAYIPRACARTCTCGQCGQPNSRRSGKAAIAAGKKNALKQKAAGKGIFKVRTCSAALAAITGKAKMTTGPTSLLNIQCACGNCMTRGSPAFPSLDYEADNLRPARSVCLRSGFVRARLRIPVSLTLRVPRPGQIVKAVWVYIKAKKQRRSAWEQEREKR